MLAINLSLIILCLATLLRSRGDIIQNLNELIDNFNDSYIILLLFPTTLSWGPLRGHPSRSSTCRTITHCTTHLQIRNIDDKFSYPNWLKSRPSICKFKFQWRNWLLQESVLKRANPGLAHVHWGSNFKMTLTSSSSGDPDSDSKELNFQSARIFLCVFR